jgi:hypothetical protein
LEYNPQNTLLSLLPSCSSTRGTPSSFSATERGLPEGATRNQYCSEMPQGQSVLKVVVTRGEMSKNVYCEVRRLHSVWVECSGIFGFVRRPAVCILPSIFGFVRRPAVCTLPSIFPMTLNLAD